MNSKFLKKNNQNNLTYQKAFTLIEVMIVVGIVAILAAVAIPNYNNFIIRGRLADMTGAMSTLRADMERYYNDNRTYTALPAPIVSPCTSPPSVAGKYTLTCNIVAATPTTPQTVTITGTGAAQISGFTFTISSNGAQATTAAPSGWGTSTTRWCLKKGCPS